MKIVLSGGHLSPLLSVLEALPKDAQVLVVGRKYPLEGDTTESLEYKTLSERKIPFFSLTTGRIQRKFTRYTVFSLLKIPYGFLRAFVLLSTYKPDVVVCFGGYISVPVAVSSFVLRIPVVIHEQTLEAGVANKIISFWAAKVCISWESSRKFFPQNKIVLTGNPARNDQKIHPNYEISKENIPFLYVTGGSTGSHAINILITGCIKKLLENYRVFHQVGDAKEYRDFERLNRLKSALPEKLAKRYYITRFVDPRYTASVMHTADLVISRAGINTVTELIYYKKIAILIPLLHGQNNEQKKNAQFFKEQGLGEIFDQDKSSGQLYNSIFYMLESKDVYKKNTAKINISAISSASKNIVSIIYQIAS